MRVVGAKITTTPFIPPWFLFNTNYNVIANTAYRVSLKQFLPYRANFINQMHSAPVCHDYQAMQVMVLPVLGDNYMYLLIDEQSKEAAVVDPVDPKTVLSEAKAANVNITTILTTHHHDDHAGGNAELVKKLEKKELKVVGFDNRIPALNKKVSQDDVFTLGTLVVKCLHTPCHTSGHICYYVTSPQATHPVVFTGDTLFVAGCGRFFEGTAKEMDTALNEKLGALPDDTRVYCGHEYTRKNLEFAKKVEPHNEDVQAKLQCVNDKRYARTPPEPTVPSTILEEKKTNPFMRVHCEEVQHFAKKIKRNDVMQVIRTAKDNF